MDLSGVLVKVHNSKLLRKVLSMLALKILIVTDSLTSLLEKVNYNFGGKIFALNWPLNYN